ncbi:hypothetical protein M409DRAFT_18195 [Zasmidium cellare ATCC 36951]|uniref:Uncharacterized protein n=1 Tax=Zasmidium cellare ATCC 36951 TaxID=1080233 RepID=A0A6A6CXR7_ZASCE|nr:uncharacterized protein M409DRAFT_18195 [Zasmidium cellare ATCC 36951]KAF2171964.1 hypothetical protein M409DRAFT_18195 [Zasmidium cellare ATCC 36951]
MATSALILLATLGTALAQPWGKALGLGSTKCSPFPMLLLGRSTIGSKAADFKNISGQFFEIEWEGLTPTGTTGRQTVPGATRNTTVPTTEGTYDVVETLARYDQYPDGTFAMYFDLGNAPIPFQNGQGTFGGYWVTFETAYTGTSETFVSWKINSCFTGSPFNFTELKEGSLANAVKILSSQGQLHGQTFPATTNDVA